MALSNCIFVEVGCACHKHVAIPAVIGPENEVPLKYSISPVPGSPTTAGEPCAATFGFIRPSTLGPRELNPAKFFNESTAPTASVLSASAGVPIKCQGDQPSFPALHTGRIPLLAAMADAIAIGVVLPFISARL